jgi:hypothetical protein
VASKKNTHNKFQGPGAFISIFVRERRLMTDEKAKVLIEEAGGIDQYFSKRATPVINEGDIVIDVMSFPKLSAAILHLEEQTGGKAMIVSPNSIDNNLVIKRTTL